MAPAQNRFNEASILKVCVDIASVAFVSYPLYGWAWAIFFSSGPAVHPLPIQIVLLFYDTAPCVFGIFWLSYRVYKASLMRPWLARVANRNVLLKLKTGAMFMVIALLLARLVLK
jgi:hypothetical protein